VGFVHGTGGSRRWVGLAAAGRRVVAVVGRGYRWWMMRRACGVLIGPCVIDCFGWMVSLLDALEHVEVPGTALNWVTGLRTAKFARWGTLRGNQRARGFLTPRGTAPLTTLGAVRHRAWHRIPVDVVDVLWRRSRRGWTMMMRRWTWIR
jgi:hypothetical protein